MTSASIGGGRVHSKSDLKKGGGGRCQHEKKLTWFFRVLRFIRKNVVFLMKIEAKFWHKNSRKIWFNELEKFSEKIYVEAISGVVPKNFWKNFLNSRCISDFNEINLRHIFSSTSFNTLSYTIYVKLC